MTCELRSCSRGSRRSHHRSLPPAIQGGGSFFRRANRSAASSLPPSRFSRGCSASMWKQSLESTTAHRHPCLSGLILWALSGAPRSGGAAPPLRAQREVGHGHQASPKVADSESFDTRLNRVSPSGQRMPDTMFAEPGGPFSSTVLSATTRWYAPLQRILNGSGTEHRERAVSALVRGFIAAPHGEKPPPAPHQGAPGGSGLPDTPTGGGPCLSALSHGLGCSSQPPPICRFLPL